MPGERRDRPYAGFYPELAPAILFFCLYLVVALVHWWRWFQDKKRYMLVLTIGMTCMSLGFLFRIVYIYNAFSLGIYILTTLFVLLSPCAFIAMDYIILPRLTLALDSQDLLFIPARYVVTIFVTSDVITFLMQAAGGGMAVSDSTASMGKKITLIGLGIQLASFCTFSCLTLVFAYRLKKSRPQLWNVPVKLFSSGSTTDWKLLYICVLLTIVAIIIRSAFRIAEYNEGYYGFLATHEAYLYTLDIMPLFLGMTLYALVWPSKWIDNAEKYNGKEQIPLA